MGNIVEVTEGRLGNYSGRHRRQAMGNIVEGTEGRLGKYSGRHRRQARGNKGAGTGGRLRTCVLNPSLVADEM